MTIGKALEILTQHNAWRRNQDDINPIEMVNPTELGEALEIAIAVMQTLHDA
ncbi:hypothetical protein UFOVP138_5 [uncultured Caudovirales phage]|uniref:Uncharacterized protein n=1 Tax=uncultured Caudovirales phage TaxID=2100421 RepID=A0A6J5LDE3_9CAUD|nr:hypothetical protein UFOVP138_5 [uncultured Caudovirales phage]